MLVSYVDQSIRGKNNTRSSDNHSFDDDCEDDLPLNEAYSLPFENQPTAESQKHFVQIENYKTPVNISDLSSWESSKDEDLFPNEQKTSLSQLKHSPGLMNLSKFLDSDEEVDELDKPTTKNQLEEKIYDSVENIPDNIQIPSEPDRILEAIADYDTGDESDWDDSPRLMLPENDNPLYKNKANDPLPNNKKAEPDILEKNIPDNNEIPSEPDKILEAIADHDMGDDDSDWDENNFEVNSLNKTKDIDPSLPNLSKAGPVTTPKKSPFQVSNLSFAEITDQQQPKSLEFKPLERPSSTKRRGSRKSRSLRSTHLAMMSRPLVKSIAIDKDDSSTASNSPSYQGDGKIYFYESYYENSKKFKKLAV